MKRAFLVAVALATVFHLVDKRLAAQTTDDLRFFKNYFVTGDYWVAGVGLKSVPPVNGFSTASITVPADDASTADVREGVPRGADILGAYLYWQVVSDTGPDTGSLGVKFKGYDLTLPDDLTTVGVVDPKPFGKVLAFAGTAACFNPGGGTGDNGSARKTYTYRMDVLRFFDVEGPGAFEGKTQIVGVPHTVSLPNFGGTSNQAPIALGASLVIIYRDTSLPLNAIVIYDDGVTLSNGQRTLDQPISGFYQPATTPNATISYIVGSGDATKNEQVTLNTALPATGTNVKLNEFSSSAGVAWDNRTYPVSLGATPTGVSSITTRVTNDIGQRDCLTLAAMVFKTSVLDSDNDGLIDKWEEADGSAAKPELYDPNGKMLPLLGLMGANKNHKDVYIELGYMDTNGVALSYGPDARPAHSHRPGHEALKLAGDTFKNAPVPNPDGFQGINVHFDVGTAYPACPVSGPCADQYIIGRHVDSGASTTTTTASGVLVTLPTGGERVDEMSTVCQRNPNATPPDQPWVCQFSDYPGTVGWKTGYRFIRDAVTAVNGAAPPANYNEDLCGTAGNNCTYRFDPSRKDMFRYAFFAHALGLPKSPDIYLADGSENPDFHVPRTNTGIGDWRGGDTLLTLGAFLDHDNVSPVGTPFQQASTLVHELGHTMSRRHNGDTLEPNCTPQYLSSMNYLYQLRGLIGPDGLPRIALSNNAQPGGVFDELHLADGGSGVSSTFRMSWYAPIAGPLALKPGVTAAKRHCDGSLITDGAQYVRVDAGDLTAIDWQLNNTTNLTVVQDINFNGLADTNAGTGSDFRLRGSSDWDKVELNQLGSRRSPGGYFLIRNADGTTTIGVGPLSLGGGKGDLGGGDLSEYALGNGKGDLGGGKGDLGVGKGDLGNGKGDLGGGKGDLGVGKGDLGNGKGDLGQGKGDLGAGDNGGGDLFGDEGEMDETLASDLTRVPPNAVTACENCATGDPTNYVRVSWVAPNVGGILRYTVYRAPIDGATGLAGTWTKLLTPGQLGTVEVPAGVGQTNRNFSWLDPDSHRLVNGVKYAYEVTATYRVKDSVTGAISQLESNGSSPDAVVGATNLVPNGVPIVNNAPTIDHSIAAQNILRNQSTQALAFTVQDTESDVTQASTPHELGVSAAITNSNNAALNAEISFVFAGSGANRTVQVVHAGTNVGTVTVQLRVTDTQCPNNPPTPCGQGTATTNAATFTVSVNRYNMVGVTNVPPAAVASVQRGKAITFEWRYTDGDTPTVVDSPTVIHQVVVVGPPGQTARTFATGFQYKSNTRTWSFTLTTKDGNTPFPAGAFTVRILSTTPLGYSPKTFALQVTP